MQDILSAYAAADAKAAAAAAKVLEAGFGTGWARVVARQTFARTLSQSTVQR